MRRHAALAVLLAWSISPAWSAPKPAPRAAQSRPSPANPSGPPHAWLFGPWTGGLFPVLDGMALQDCRTQPTVVFGQDTLAHAGLTTPDMTQRVIETVRASPSSAEFRLTPDPADPAGFGCDDPDVLRVAREGENTISFPHCAGFPYTLERCPPG